MRIEVCIRSLSACGEAWATTDAAQATAARKIDTLLYFSFQIWRLESFCFGALVVTMDEQNQFTCYQCYLCHYLELVTSCYNQ